MVTKGINSQFCSVWVLKVWALNMPNGIKFSTNPRDLIPRLPGPLSKGFQAAYPLKNHPLILKMEKNQICAIWLAFPLLLVFNGRLFLHLAVIPTCMNHLLAMIFSCLDFPPQPHHPLLLCGYFAILIQDCKIKSSFQHL